MKTSKFILAFAILFAGYYIHIHHEFPHGKELREREKFRAEDNVTALTRIEEGNDTKIGGQI